MEEAGSHPEISVCIPSWNTCSLLRECLGSIQAVCGFPHEIIVVDNASRDGSGEMVKRDFPRVRLIENETNRGYSGATNQALAAARARLLVLLNSDIFLREDVFGELAGFLEARPLAGAAAPLLRRPNGHIQRSWGPLPGMRAEISRVLLLDRLASLPWDGSEEACEVESLMGACLMVKREALLQVGMLDEGFLHYGEDVDLCWRLKRAGWRVYLLPWLEVIHHGAASSRQIRREAWLNYHRSKCRLFRKYLGQSAVAAEKLLLTAEGLTKGAAALLRASPCGRRKARDCAALLRSLWGF